MTQPTQRFRTPAERSETALTERDPSNLQPATASGKPRKPYQRPSVQKRRSVAQATLVSSGGTGGSLVNGGG